MTTVSTKSARNRKLNAWVKRIAAVSMPNVFNPWKQRNELDVGADGPGLRVKRLKLHLDNPSAKILMVGEAPGHLGAKYSGIPFTSERLLIAGEIPRLEQHGQARISTRKLPFSEPSATIIWKVAHTLGIEHQIILWNAFPWHPYKDALNSNRTPTKAELTEGLTYLKDLISFFPQATLVAIGRKSQGSLEGLQLPHVPIRHPSMGGAPAFTEGMTSLVSSFD